MKIKLQRVHYMPKVLELGVLYVSKEYGIAAHLCPCGCGSKVTTPLGLTDWVLEETNRGPTLYPSIGNWQLPCQSHYWIADGRVVWSIRWTPKQIAAGRRAEEARQRSYYDSLDHRQRKVFRDFWRWVHSIIKR